MKFKIDDPMSAHFDLLGKYTDDDMHNVFAISGHDEMTNRIGVLLSFGLAATAYSRIHRARSTAGSRFTAITPAGGIAVSARLLRKTSASCSRCGVFRPARINRSSRHRFWRVAFST